MHKKTKPHDDLLPRHEAESFDNKTRKFRKKASSFKFDNPFGW